MIGNHIFTGSLFLGVRDRKPRWNLTFDRNFWPFCQLRSREQNGYLHQSLIHNITYGPGTALLKASDRLGFLAFF